MMVVTSRVSTPKVFRLSSRARMCQRGQIGQILENEPSARENLCMVGVTRRLGIHFFPCVAPIAFFQ